MTAATETPPAPAGASDNPPSRKGSVLSRRADELLVRYAAANGNWVSDPDGYIAALNAAHADFVEHMSALENGLSAAHHALRSYQHGNVAPALAQATADHLAALLGDDGGVPARLLPTAITPAIVEVLGQKNFVVGPIAHAFQAAGEAIPKRYEAEQAHVLFRFLHLALEHGDGWRPEAGKQLKAAIEAAKARQAGEVAP